MTSTGNTISTGMLYLKTIRWKSKRRRKRRSAKNYYLWRKLWCIFPLHGWVTSTNSFKLVVDPRSAKRTRLGSMISLAAIIPMPAKSLINLNFKYLILILLSILKPLNLIMRVFPKFPSPLLKKIMRMESCWRESLKCLTWSVLREEEVSQDKLIHSLSTS